MRTALPLLVVALGAACLAGLLAGSSGIGPMDALRALVGSGDDISTRIVRGIRLPSVLLAVAAGAFLGAGGALVQSVLRNPLADPWILGVSGGAGIGTAAVVGLDLGRIFGPAALPLGGVLGALVAVAFIDQAALLLHRRDRNAGPHTLLLAGVILNAFAGAVLLLVHLFVDPARSQQLLFLLMGNVDPARALAPTALVAALLGCLSLGVAWLGGPLVDALTFGDDHARAVGLAPERTRRGALGVLALLAGSAVALAGLLGFVGLIVPHLVRPLVGVRQRALVPAAAIAGATFVVCADAAARSVFPLLGTGLPTGALTAVIGAPFFLVLLLRGRSDEGIA